MCAPLLSLAQETSSKTMRNASVCAPLLSLAQETSSRTMRIASVNAHLISLAQIASLSSAQRLATVDVLICYALPTSLLTMMSANAIAM